MAYTPPQFKGSADQMHLLYYSFMLKTLNCNQWYDVN